MQQQFEIWRAPSSVQLIKEDKRNGIVRQVFKYECDIIKCNIALLDEMKNINPADLAFYIAETKF